MAPTAQMAQMAQVGAAAAASRHRSGIILHFTRLFRLFSSEFLYVTLHEWLVEGFGCTAPREEIASGATTSPGQLRCVAKLPIIHIPLVHVRYTSHAVSSLKLQHPPGIAIQAQRGKSRNGWNEDGNEKARSSEALLEQKAARVGLEVKKRRVEDLAVVSGTYHRVGSFCAGMPECHASSNVRGS